MVQERKTGRTTRIVDECVQTFFKRGEVWCYDHYNVSLEQSVEGSMRVAAKIINRLGLEYGLKVNEDFKLEKDKKGIIKITKHENN